MSSFSFVRGVAAISLAAAMIACGGKTEGVAGSGADRSGDPPASGGSASAGGSVGGSGSASSPGMPCPIPNLCAPDRLVSPRECKSDPGCYTRSTTCNGHTTVLYCVPEPAICDGLPACDPGDTEVTGCPNDGTSCYLRETCGTTILCRETPCKPPSCDAGDRVVTDASICASPGIVCYTRTSCTATLTCQKLPPEG